MPSLDFEVSDIPDIIEAQLTLSYSRLTQLLHSIVDQGNGHESDIASIYVRLDALENENRELQTSLTRAQEDNAALRNIIEDDKKEKESGGQISSDDLVNKLSALHDNVEELATKLNSRVDDLQSSLTSQREEHKKEHNKLCDTVEHMKDNFDDLQRKIGSNEQRIELLDAFVKLWDVDIAKMNKVHRVHESNGKPMDAQDALGDTENKTMDAQTQYLLSLKPFESIVDELNVLKAMQVQQAADALSAKMAAAESVRNSRSNSQVKRAFDSPLTAALKNDEKVAEGATRTLHSQEHSQEKPKDNDLSLLVHELQDKVAFLEANQKRLGNSISHKNKSPLLTSPSSSSPFANAPIARSGNTNINSNSNDIDGVDNKRRGTNSNVMAQESLTPEAIHEMVAKDVAVLDGRIKHMEERLNALLLNTTGNTSELPNATLNPSSQTDVNAALLPTERINTNNTNAVLTDVRLRVKSLEDVIHGVRKSVHFATSQQQDTKAMRGESLPDAYNKQYNNNMVVNNNEQKTMESDHVDGKPHETATRTKITTSSGNGDNDNNNDDDVEIAQHSIATLPPLVPEMNKLDKGSSSAAASFSTQQTQQENNTHVKNNFVNTEGASLHDHPEGRYEKYHASTNNNQTDNANSITPIMPNGRANEVNKEYSAQMRCTQAACDINDGLCKRVSQLEKNVTLLDLNKADRAELRQLQLAIQAELASLHKALPLDVATDNNVSNGKYTHTPRRPLSANGSHNAQQVDGRDATLHMFQHNYNNGNGNNYRPRTASATPSQQWGNRLGMMP